MSSNWKGRLCVVLLCVLLVLDVVKGSWLLKGGREVGWYGREEEGGNGTVDDGGGSGGNGTVDDGEGSGGNGTDTVVLEAKKVLKKYREVIIGVSIPLGFLGAFFGYYLFQPFIFLAAAMVSGGFFYLAVQASTVGSVHQTWLTITSSLLGGIIIGITAIKAIRLGVFLMGFSLGAAISLAVVRTAFYGKIDLHKPPIGFVTAVCAVGLVGGFLALFMEKQMVVIATSYGGAFAATYGIGHFAGHFPDLIEWKAGSGDEYWSSVYPWLYFAGFIVLGTVGCIVQFAFTSKNNKRVTRRRFWGRANSEDYSDNESEASYDDYIARNTSRRGMNIRGPTRGEPINLNVVVQTPNGDTTTATTPNVAVTQQGGHRPHRRQVEPDVELGDDMMSDTSDEGIYG